MSTKELAIVCAGIGNQGGKHRIPALLTAAPTQNLWVPAIVDPVIERAEAYLAEYANAEYIDWLGRRGYAVSPDAVGMFRDARVFARIEDAIDRGDAVMSVVPGGAKMVVGRVAAEAGKHLFSDKPTAPTAEEAAELYELFTSRGLALKIGYHLADMVRVVVDLLVSEGVVINQWALSWVRANGIPGAEHFWADPATGGVTRDLGGHLAALIRILTGHDPVKVLSAIASNEAGRKLYGDAFKAEDSIEAIVAAQNDTLTQITASWGIGFGPSERLKIEGFGPDDEEVELRLHANKSDLHMPDTRAFRMVLRREGHERPFAVGHHEPMLYTRSMIKGIVDFARQCRGAGSTDPNPVMIERTVAGMLEAARTGGEVELV